MFTIKTGVQSGPIWNQQQVGQAQQQLGNPNARMPMMPTGMNPPNRLMGTLGEQLGNIVQQGGQANALNFGREASLGNAQHLLRSQQARSGAGINWANLLSNQYGTELNTQLMGRNALMNLLSRFL